MEEAGVETGYESAFSKQSGPGGSPLNLFADSSALAKRYIADESSEDFDQLLAGATSLAVSVLCLPELISALCRRRRERLLKPAEYAAAKSALERDLADTTIIQLIDDVIVESIDLLERHPLRASDAIQIASYESTSTACASSLGTAVGFTPNQIE